MRVVCAFIRARVCAVDIVGQHLVHHLARQRLGVCAPEVRVELARLGLGRAAETPREKLRHTKAEQQGRSGRSPRVRLYRRPLI